MESHSFVNVNQANEMNETKNLSKKRAFMRIGFLFVMTLLVAALLSCRSKSNDKSANKGKPPVPVDVLVAFNSEFSSDIEVNGTVLPDESVELHPEVSGRITYLNIPDGSLVKEGTVLVRINDADLQAQVRQQKVQLDLAEKTELRLRQLLAVNGVDQATYDAALNQVQLIEANLSLLNAQIDKTIIRAPFTGRLGLRLVSEGAYVSPATVIGTIQQTDRIKIDFSVPEAYESLIKTGKTVTVRTNGSAQGLTAVIRAIEPQINQGSRSFRVRAGLDGGTIHPGAFVKVLLSEKVSGILIPTNAVIPDALSNQVVLVKDGKALFRNVETGIRTSDAVEITNGVLPGDSVVVSGVLYVRPNGHVRIKTSRERVSENSRPSVPAD